MLNLDSGVEFLGWTVNGETIDTATLTIDEEGDIVLVASLNKPISVDEEPAEDDGGMTIWPIVSLVVVFAFASFVALKSKKAKSRNEEVVTRDDGFDGGDES